MPFSSLSDPVDVARAQAAMEAAWAEIQPTIPTATHAQERLRLTYIVTALTGRVSDEDDLAKRAIERYHRAVQAEGRG